MRVVFAVVLCAVAVLAQGKKKRTVADLLAGYAIALGDFQQVKALHATGSLGGDLGMSVYYKDGKCVRTLHGRGVRTEWVNDAGVFILFGGFFERYRVELPAQRSMYYAQKMAANPFPLLPFVHNKVAAAGLKPGFADMVVGKGKNKKKVRFEVLGTGPDRYGVTTEFLFHPQTHHLTVVLFKRGKETIAAVRYWQHKQVQGVLLPGAVEMFTPFLLENEKVKKGPVTRNDVRRVDQYLKWTVNPDLKGVSFEVPGVGPKGAKGFLRVELATGPDPAELAVGDVDADGKLDIVVACHGGVWVHFGGAMRKPVKVPLGEWSHRGLVIEDMDCDGRPEIITMSRLLPSEMFFVVSFDVNRKPRIHKILGAPFLGNGMACADLDMDGLGDLVASGWAETQLDIKFGNGQRSFRVAGIRWPLAKTENRSPRGFGVAIGRLDKDHLKDIVVADGMRVRAFLGQLNGGFLPAASIMAGPRPVDVCFADVNADGKPDLLVANDRGGMFGDLKGDIAVILNLGAGKWKFHAKFEAGVRTPTVRAGYFNADRHIDFATASFLTGDVRVLHGDGKGGFKPGARLRSGRGTYRLHITDFDGDGADDILATNRLDDTVTILLNRNGAPARPGRAPPRARACKAVVVPFKLQGLTSRYEFAGEFRIPADIRDPSGLAFLGGAESYRQLVLVSDKEPSIFRIVLDVRRKRLLVGPRIPLLGVKGRLDLEGAAFDGTGNLFLASEADSSILRVSLFGHVISRVPTGIAAGKNDGIEGLALRRKKDGTPLLYVFRERMGKTGKQPPVHVYEVEEDPFSLKERLVTKIPFATPDQTGATVADNRMYVVSRARREIFEFGFDGRGFSSTPRKSASFAKLTDDLLGLNSLFGVAEAIAIDAWGDLYLLIDNNGKVMGKQGLNRGNEGRLLWFRALDRPNPPPDPRQVVVKHIYIPWAGARGNPNVKRTRAEADELSQSIARKLRGGANFDVLAKEYHHANPGFPQLMTIKLSQAKPGRGEFNRDKLPRSFARLAFALEVGEVGVAEFHRIECPYGFHVLMRIP